MHANGFLGVGSIVEFESSLLMICGYRAIDRDGKTKLAYFAVPYPYGFMGLDSLLVIHTDARFKVISGGFTSSTARELLDILEKVEKQGASTSFQEYSHAMHDVVETVSKGDTL